MQGLYHQPYRAKHPKGSCLVWLLTVTVAAEKIAEKIPFKGPCAQIVYFGPKVPKYKAYVI